jgi:hypothetical protein
MKTIKTILILCAALCFATACKKEVDMTLIQKTVLENADIRQIEVGDAWQVTVVADSSTFVELEYSAYLEPYLKTKMEGTQLEIGFTGKVYPVMGSVYKAKVHTAHFNRVEAKDATILNFEGSFYSDDDSLNIVLNDASLCNGLDISGKYNKVSLNDASKFVGFHLDGTNNLVYVKDASVCKGSFETRFHFFALLEDASQLVTFEGATPYGQITLRDGSLVNMAQTEIRELNVNLSGASEATVNVTETMTGSLTDASTLYYKGIPTIDVNCSEDSQLIPF